MRPTAEFLHYELAVERARRVSAERVVLAQFTNPEAARHLARAHEVGWMEPERDQFRQAHETKDFVDDE